MSSDNQIVVKQENNALLDFKYKEAQFLRERNRLNRAMKKKQQNKDDWAYDNWKDNQEAII